MSEMKAWAFSMALFVGFIVPVFLQLGVGSLHQHAFIKQTTELSEIIQEEGGMTSKANNAINQLEERGYSFNVRDKFGSRVTNKRSFGDTIVVDTNYKYMNVRGEEELNTQNVIFITRR